MVDKKETWVTEDGKEFSTKEEALSHEKEVKDPMYKLEKRIEYLESEVKILHELVQKLKWNPYGTTVNSNKTDIPGQKPITWYTATVDADNIDEAADKIKEMVYNVIGGAK